MGTVPTLPAGAALPAPVLMGDDSTVINMVDANGINLAATQGLYAIVQEQQARIEALEQRNTQLLIVALGASLLFGIMGGVAVMKLRR